MKIPVEFDPRYDPLQYPSLYIMFFKISFLLKIKKKTKN